MKAAAKSFIGCGWNPESESKSTQNRCKKSTNKYYDYTGDGNGLKELKLNCTEMTFSKEQLGALNRYLGDLQTSSTATTQYSTITGHKEISDVVERLVQRLLCGVGALDSKFSSKFLIKLHEEHCTSSETEYTQRFEYLVRFDKLSTSSSSAVNETNLENEVICRLIDDTEDETLPQGYVRIVVQGNNLTEWSEFLTSNGYLRRDKIQERFVELLALSAGGASPNNPGEVDESKCCGVPGKVADAAIVYQILKVPSQEQLFYGPIGNEKIRYPDPRDFRIAIVEEPTGIRLRIGFLSPALNRNGDVEVYLILGIGLDGWPASSDFPHRVDLAHPEFLIYYKTAQTGMYVVSIAPCSSLKSDTKSIIWRLCFPAARNTLMSHYSTSSLPNKILNILTILLQRINRQEKLKLVTKNIMLTLLWLELENSYSSPSKLLINWLPEMLSYHVLKILNNLVIALRNEFQRSYIFPKQNIFFMLNMCVDDDFVADAEQISSFLEHLYEESMLIQKFDNDNLIKERVQTELTMKWVQIMADLAPPSINKSYRLSFTNEFKDKNLAAASQFTKKQLEYLKFVFLEILKVHEVITGNPYIFFDNEKLIYILSYILDQALLFYTKNVKLKNKYVLNKTEAQLENSKQILFRIVSKETKMLKIILDNDNILVAQVLKWLYRALDEDKRFLAPLLRPFLSRLFLASYENSWHIDAWKRREYLDELSTLGTFSKLVNDGLIKPLTGIMDAGNKGWFWAQDILELIQSTDLNLILVPNGSTIRHELLCSKSNYGFRTLKNAISRNTDYMTLKNNYKGLTSAGSLPSTLKLSVKCQFSTEDIEENLQYNKTLSHSEIRDLSPMNKILELCRRYGQHRCLGDIMESLVGLNKLTILQEISTLLPDVERLQMLDTIHRISKGTHRRHIRTLRSRTAATTEQLSTTTSRKLNNNEGKTKTLNTNTKVKFDNHPTYRQKQDTTVYYDDNNDNPTAEAVNISYSNEKLRSNNNNNNNNNNSQKKYYNEYKTKHEQKILDLFDNVETDDDRKEYVNDIKNNWQTLIESNYFETGILSTSDAVNYYENHENNIIDEDDGFKTNWQSTEVVVNDNHVQNCFNNNIETDDNDDDVIRRTIKEQENNLSSKITTKL